MAPPKRKTGGGRTTPKGTRPGQPVYQNPEENDQGVHSSTRYTPPVTSKMREPQPWVPWVGLTLIVLAGVVIMARNLVFAGNNWLVLIGLGLLVVGMYTLTKWR